MFGIDAAKDQVLAVVGAVLLAALVGLGVVVWWQYGKIERLNETVGSQAAQVEQLSTSLADISKQNDDLRLLRQQESRIREATHDELERLRAQIAQERSAAEDRIAADPDSRQFLEVRVSGAVDRRLRELYPAQGGRGDRDAVPDGADGHDPRHAGTGVSPES